MNRADLVEVAQQIYDAELEQRGLTARLNAKPVEPKRAATAPRDNVPSEESAEDEYPIYEADPLFDQSVEPEWIGEAAEVFSRTESGATAVAAADMADVRDALESAGIPCYLELTELPEEQVVNPARPQTAPPGQLNLRATSILERDIFNKDFEAEWKAHLETLSDHEVRAMNPEEAFCGLFDKIERVHRVYGEELVRRGLDPSA